MPFDRIMLMQFLEAHNVETRVLFAGNIVRQPGFLNVKSRIVGNLEYSDFIMNNSFFIGVYPGLTEACLHRMTRVFEDFIHKYHVKTRFFVLPSPLG